MFLNSFFVCDRVELYASLTKCIVRRDVRDISQTNLGTSMRAKSFSHSLPFGSRETCRREITNASYEKLAHLIKICGFLMQTEYDLQSRKG